MADTLNPGQSLAPGKSLTSQDGGCELIYQMDGNLVLYQTADGQAIWDSKTAITPPGAAIMQTDGNFVLYIADGAGPYWATGTNRPGSWLRVVDGSFAVGDTTSWVWSGSQLHPGQLQVGGSLLPGQILISPNNIYWFNYQPDGNLVVFRTADRFQLWESQTAGKPAGFVVMQWDGNFVVYGPGGHEAWWASRANIPGSFVATQSAGLRQRVVDLPTSAVACGGRLDADFTPCGRPPRSRLTVTARFRSPSRVVVNLKAALRPNQSEVHMSSVTVETPHARGVDMKLEVVVIPVSDVDRAKRFYGGLGWRLDADYASEDGYFRVIQFTPSGSGCSVIFGKNVTAATPGSAQGLYLIVSDVEAARKELVGRGVEISGVFHDAAGVHAGPDEPYLFGRIRVAGPDPQHASYHSFASFSDPDGNGWLLQELTQRAPGRVDSDAATFTSSADLAAALRRAEAAHGEHEKRTGGQRDENWPDWYAEYLIREQARKELPL